MAAGNPASQTHDSFVPSISFLAMSAMFEASTAYTCLAPACTAKCARMPVPVPTSNTTFPAKFEGFWQKPTANQMVHIPFNNRARMSCAELQWMPSNGPHLYEGTLVCARAHGVLDRVLLVRQQAVVVKERVILLAMFSHGSGHSRRCSRVLPRHTVTSQENTVRLLPCCVHCLPRGVGEPLPCYRTGFMVTACVLCAVLDTRPPMRSCQSHAGSRRAVIRIPVPLACLHRCSEDCGATWCYWCAWIRGQRCI